jgi:hypothetical protein
MVQQAARNHLTTLGDAPYTERYVRCGERAAVARLPPTRLRPRFARDYGDDPLMQIARRRIATNPYAHVGLFSTCPLCTFMPDALKAVVAEKIRRAILALGRLSTSSQRYPGERFAHTLTSLHLKHGSL